MSVPQVTECVEAAHYWYQWHPPIGVFIGILGFVAIFVPFSWDKAGSNAKRIVTIALFALLSLELRSIYYDAQEHKQDQTLAECRMQKIADKIERISKDAEQQYKDTIGKVVDVLDTAKDVQKLSATNLLNTTGGDAYGYVKPRYRMKRDYSLFQDSFRVYNDFDQLLSGVTVKVAMQNNPNRIGTGTTRQEEYSINSLGPHSSARVDYLPNENYWLANTLRFRITIGAQNGVVLENLELRPTKDGKRWEYQFDIIRSVSKIHRGRAYEKDSSGNLYRGDGGVYSEIVKHQDWTEREEEFPH